MWSSCACAWPGCGTGANRCTNKPKSGLAKAGERKPMARRGVIIGKFYPPHRGHKYLIDTGRASVDQLTVIVCDKPGQVPPAQLRAAWLREIHPNVEVMVVDDRLDDDDSKGWAEYTIQTL